MPKATSRLDLALPPRTPGTTAVRWLYDAIRERILDGRLPPGARLPSTRDLACQYDLARGTIVEAFEELRWEGYLEARVGAGTRVSPTLPDSLLEAAPRSSRDPGGRASPARALSDLARRVRFLDNLQPGPVRAFRTNQPAVDLFPQKLWAQVAGRRLRRASADLWLSCDPLGYRPLREAVAEYLATSRGVGATADRVAIVSGVQEGFDLASRLLVSPGDRVAMESPGYEGARRVFEALGARVVDMAVDDEGMVLDPARLGGVRLVYVTPAHQYPVGVAMSLARRLSLLEWAAGAAAVVFEDDYDSEFRYAGRPLPALQGLDRHGQVLFSGTFGKVLLPALRLGYLVVPDDLVDPVAALQSITRRHAPVFEQAVLADFMTSGHFGRHVRRMREVYAERLGVLLEAVAEEIGEMLEVSGIEAGLQTVGWLAEGMSAERVVRLAARREVELQAVATPDGRQGLHLGFAAVGPEELRRGVRELAAVLERETSHVLPGGRGPGHGLRGGRVSHREGRRPGHRRAHEPG